MRMTHRREHAKATPSEPLRQRIRAIVVKHAPWLADDKAVPTWSSAIADRVRATVLKTGAGDQGIDVVNRLLHEAEMQGRGRFERLEPTRHLRVTSSRLCHVSPKDLARVNALLGAIHDQFNGMGQCQNPSTLAGIVMISGAFHSCILNRHELVALVADDRPVEAAAGMPVLDLASRDEAKGRRRRSSAATAAPNGRQRDNDPVPAETDELPAPRRRALHDATAFLLRRYREVALEAPTFDPDSALAAASQHLGQEPLGLRTLTRLAKGYFATRLPSWLLEVVQNPVLCPSLDPPTWHRWIHGHHDHAPRLPSAEDGLIATALRVSPADAPQNMSARDLKGATTELIATLRRGRDDPPLNDQVIAERLRVWRERHGKKGGWLQLMHDWIVAQSIGRDGGAYGSQYSLKPPGLMRYASGFFRVFIEEFREIPVHHVHQPEKLHDAMERVVSRILQTRSPLPGCVGLRSFLRAIIRMHSMDEDLEDHLTVGSLPVHRRTRLITPSDYLAARKLIQQNHGSQPLVALQYKVALALAWRTGIRFGELASRQLADFRLITVDGRLIGDLRIEGNSAYAMKTRSSRRWIPLHILLTPHEMKEMHDYIDLRRAMLRGVLSEEDLLFADVATPKIKTVKADLGIFLQDLLRKVTADPNVVLHDLRHSAASLLMIRLFDEGRLRGAFDGIPGYAANRESFGTHVPLSRALCGDQIEHPSRLYALARLMGHLDPEMTMTYYVHTADLIIGATVRRLVVLPREVRSIIEGVKADSIRRRDKRRVSGAKARMGRIRETTGSASPKRPVRRRVRLRHDVGITGSYSALHARKVVEGVVSGHLSVSRSKHLGINDAIVDSVKALADSGMSRFIPRHIDFLTGAMQHDEWLADFNVLVENAVRKRRPSWVKQIDALSKEPMKVVFDNLEDAEERLRLLQKNGRCSRLVVKPWKGAADHTPAFAIFEGCSWAPAIRPLIPVFALVALMHLDRARAIAPSAAPDLQSWHQNREA